jgi:predicted phage-related endonuclease
MSKTWDYSEDKKRVVIEPPKQRLRITGHRMASVLGLNEYQSPFGAWAEITKLVKLPFEDTKYTLAGKALEPKIIEYVSKQLPNVVSIEEYYGNNFEDYRYNNFKDDSNVFGGVIDAVSTLNDKQTITMILECKTSSKPQLWANGNVPTEYLLQGALYSYLKGLDKIVFACTFLKDADYNHPEMVEVNKDNTVIVIKNLSDMLFEVDGEYLNIEGCMQKATEWWNKYIETGISPEFDEKKDKEYLDIIRSTDATKDNELEDVCEQAIKLHQTIQELKVASGIDEMEKLLKKYETSIKSKMMDEDIATCGMYTLKKSVKEKFKEDDFKEANPGLYEQYVEKVETYTLSKNKKKEE